MRRTHDRDRQHDDHADVDPEPLEGLWPGKRTLTMRLAPVYRQATGQMSAPAEAKGAVAAAVDRGGGEPLPDELRARFAAALGVDLAGVRVHTGDESAAAARAIGARAFAIGQDIHFGAGEYRPDDPAGQHLIAHEVAHTAQQRGAGELGAAQAKLDVSSPGDAAEVEAERAADAMVAGRPASVTPTGGTARTLLRDADASVQPPNLNHEVVIDLAKSGAYALKFKVKWAFGEGAAATAKTGGGNDGLAFFGEAQANALEPKLAASVSDRAARLSVAVVDAGFDLVSWEGLSLAFEISGPEASLDGKGIDLNAIKVAVVGSGDITRWVEGLPPAVSLSAEVEGSFTIGGKLLAQLAEMAAIADGLDHHATELERAAHDEAAASRRQRELEQRRKGLASERERLFGGAPDPDRGNLVGAVEKSYDAEIRALDGEIETEKLRVAEAADRRTFHRSEIERAAGKLRAAEETLDGRFAKRLGGRISAAVRRRLDRMLGVVLPLLGLVGLVSDVIAVVGLLVAWRESGYGLPQVGGGGPDPFGGGDQPTDGDGDRGSGGVGGTDGPGGSADGTQAHAPPPDAAAREGDATQPATTNGATGGAGDHAAPDARDLHPVARRVLRAMERKGVALDEDQIRAVGRIVPADLGEEDLRALVDRVLVSGTPPRDGSELLVFLAEAVQDAAADEPPTVMVDGQPLAALDANASPPRAPEKPRRKGKKARKAPRDRRIEIEVEEARTWFAPGAGGRLETTDAYQAWRLELLTAGEERVDGVAYMATDVNASGSVTPQGLWDVSVELTFGEIGGDRTRQQVFRWLIDPQSGGSSPVVADDVTPLSRLVRYTGPQTPPEIEHGVADFGNYQLEIAKVLRVEHVPGEQVWRITFQFVVAAATADAGGVLDDEGSSIPLIKDQTFVKTVDVLPSR